MTFVLCNAFNAIFPKNYNSGNEILFDLQSQPEMAELFTEVGPGVTVNVNSDIGDGFDAEIKSLCDCSEYRGNFSHIHIKKMGVEQQRGAVIFELTNLASRRDFSQVSFDLSTQAFKTAEAYAKAKEQIEFNGIIRTLEIERRINERLGTKWVDSKFSNIPQKVIEEKDFETYYNNHLLDFHKQYYREIWHKKMGVPLDSSNKKIAVIALSTVVAAVSVWKFTR